MSQKKNLQALIAEDKIAPAIAHLLATTNQTPDLHNEVLQLSARFQQNEKQRRLDLNPTDDLNREYNKIRNALLDLVNRLPESSITPLTRKSNWVAIGLFLVGLVAFIANIGTIKDTLFKKDKPEPPKIETLSTPESKKEDLKPAPTQPTAPVFTATKTSNSTKNNVNIHLRDKAKVGAIITGDSNKIDLKQDF